MNIAIASNNEVDALWPIFAERLQLACEKTGGDISSGDLWQMCRSGNAFLLVVSGNGDFVAALIMQFQKWTSKQVMRCLGIVGTDMDLWMPMAKDFISNMAREGGATSFVAEGREGWSAIFPEAKKLRVTYEVKL